MMAILVFLSLVTVPAIEAQTPLTPEQVTAVQKLVRTTQERDEELKESLDQLQAELAAAYSQFELNDQLVSELQKKILDNQQQLFETYHAMQVELRTIVGRERFAMLKRRIDRVLKSRNPGDSASEPARGSDR